MIHEEIARLPERYREPLVLCYLEGLRHHEIAERLECPVGTVESRLSRGRERLRSRLERRGVAPTASVPGLALLAKGVPATVPASLVEATLRCASGLASRRVAAEVAAASVATLAGASSGPHLGYSLPALVACAGVFAAGLVAYSSWAPGDSPKPPEVAQAAETPLPRPISTPALEALARVFPAEPIASEALPPASPPRPSRPDSAVAAPLEKITIDGRLADWPTGLDRHPIRRRLVGVSAHDSTATGPDAVPRADFRVGYDKATGRIYLAVEVEDEDLVVSPVDPWHTDAVEVYVDGLFTERSVANSSWEPDASKLPVIQYAGVPGPVAAYGDPKGSNPALMFGKIAETTTQMAHRRVGNITTYEWAVQAFDRFPDRPTRLEPGKRVGFEVVVVDKDRDRAKSTWLHWGPTWAGFKTLDAASLGELILVDGP